MDMIKRSLNNPQAFLRTEEISGGPFYGCEQEWYETDWQKRSGCGPTTACNLLYYLQRAKAAKDPGLLPLTKEFGLKRMQESWEYVTPTEMGVYSTKLFKDGLVDYARNNGLKGTCHVIDKHQAAETGDYFKTVIQFIETALVNDSPVAFLNLCNGEVNNLDKWHWVTILVLEYDAAGTMAYVDIMDEGHIKKIDLKLWCKTTTLGGGFVYLEVI